MSILQVIKWWRVLEPVARPIVGAIIKAIATDKDPEYAAKRALRALAHDDSVEAWARDQGVIK